MEDDFDSPNDSNEPASKTREMGTQCYIYPGDDEIFNFECQYYGLYDKGTQVTSPMAFDVQEVYKAAYKVCRLELPLAQSPW